MQNLASHSYVSPIFIGGNMLMEIEFVARETQDFASLQGWRHCNVMMRMYVLYRCRLKVETQNLASHG